MPTVLTEQYVSELKAKHGDRLIAVTNPSEMVFKKPSRMVWADFQDSISKDKGTREMAYRRLALACLVHPPSEDDAKQVFDEYPALVTKIGDKLSELVGLGDETEIKKL